MTKFFKDVWYELKRTGPRIAYFFRHGQLHPECLPPWERLEIPDAPLAPRPKTFRLWDKDFNLLWSGTGEELADALNKHEEPSSLDGDHIIRSEN